MTFDKLCQLLLENPIADRSYVPTSKDTSDGNLKDFNTIINSKYKRIDNFEGYAVFVYSGIPVTTYYFLDLENMISIAEVAIETLKRKLKKHFISNTIWKYRNAEKNLMIKIFKEFLLKKYPNIESLDQHSTEARYFWETLIRYLIIDGYRCSAVFIENSDKYSEEIFADVEHFVSLLPKLYESTHYRLKVYAKL